MPSVYRNKRELLESVVAPDDAVLDVGFFGQGVREDDPNWGHRLILGRAKEAYGVDLEPYRPADPSRAPFYLRASAEDFSFGRRFTLVYAGDLIEHLSNPGLFLANVRRHLAPGGRLVLTTPNAFNLFNVAGKLTRDEPVVNADHTCYFNAKTIEVLLRKNGFRIGELAYLRSLEVRHRESWKKKGLNVLYRVLARFTPKFLEDLVVVAVPEAEA